MATALSTGSLPVGVNTVWTGVTYLNSLQVFTDGVNAATVNVYNNTTNSGQLIAAVKITGATLMSQPISLANPVRCDIGLTIEVIGTGATAVASFGAAS